MKVGITLTEHTPTYKQQEMSLKSNKSSKANAANYPESIFIGIKDPGLAFFVSSLRHVL